MKALILALKKLITILIAVAVPVAPAFAPNYGNTTPAAVIAEHREYGSDYVFEDPEIDENEEDPVFEEPTNGGIIDNQDDNDDLEVAQTAEFAAPEDDELIIVESKDIGPIMQTSKGTIRTTKELVAIENDANDEEYVPVMTWDVSATEDDNVTMEFYDTEDTAGIIEQLAGRVTALFAPMTAFAAEDEETAAQADDGVKIYYEDTEELETVDYGNGDFAEVPTTYLEGTVVISGNGNMTDYVYNYFLSGAKYVNAVRAMLVRYYGEDVTPINYDPDIDDVMVLDETLRWQFTATGEEVEVPDELRDNLSPADLLKYSPKHIIIKEGVTNIAQDAFAFCEDVVDVQLPTTLKHIGINAFMYCTSLERIDIPQGVEVIEYGAFQHCEKLAVVNLPESLRAVNNEAFAYLAEGSVINCPVYYVERLFADGIYTAANTTIVTA